MAGNRHDTRPPYETALIWLPLGIALTGFTQVAMAPVWHYGRLWTQWSRSGVIRLTDG